MKELIFEKTRNTPWINFNPSDGVMEIEGRSIPENPENFFYPMLDWVHQYFEDPKSFTLCKIKLEYVNSVSAKFILALLRAIKKYFDKGHDCKVEWHYEEGDEAIHDLGEHFSDTTKLPFEFKVIH